jgi:hypothetical protein
VPILELHPPVLDAHHRTNETGLRVFDDHAQLDRLFGGAWPAGAVRVIGQDVGTIAICHRMILGINTAATT